MTIRVQLLEGKEEDAIDAIQKSLSSLAETQ